MMTTMPNWLAEGRVMISVIVPTCNEENLLPGCLESIIKEQRNVQVIVVDGGSNDNTLTVARQYTKETVAMDKTDLAAQLNTGAAIAKGEILLFLHADSRLTNGCLGRIETLPPDVVGGAFTMQLESKRFFYRALSLGGNIYCRLTGTYFGDRGIFVRTSAFRRLGGFVNIPIMSDVEFSLRLKRLGRTVLLQGPVISSSRKFDQEGSLHTLYLIIYALLAFKLGLDPEKIKSKYYHLDTEQ
jgi:rSAM/selenodomain-associated transferase 2